jgi:hypothetical protein
VQAAQQILDLEVAEALARPGSISGPKASPTPPLTQISSGLAPLYRVGSRHGRTEPDLLDEVASAGRQLLVVRRIRGGPGIRAPLAGRISRCASQARTCTSPLAARRLIWRPVRQLLHSPAVDRTAATGASVTVWVVGFRPMQRSTDGVAVPLLALPGGLAWWRERLRCNHGGTRQGCRRAERDERQWTA